MRNDILLYIYIVSGLFLAIHTLYFRVTGQFQNEARFLFFSLFYFPSDPQWKQSTDYIYIYIYITLLLSHLEIDSILYKSLCA